MKLNLFFFNAVPLVYWRTWLYNPKHESHPPCTRSWCQNLLLPGCRNSTIPTGVGHAADISLVWNSKSLNATGQHVARDASSFWQTFAASGHPHGPPGRPAWPAYGARNSTMVLDVNPHVQENLDSTRCDFWDQTHPVPWPTARSSLL